MTTGKGGGIYMENGAGGTTVGHLVVRGSTIAHNRSAPPPPRRTARAAAFSLAYGTDLDVEGSLLDSNATNYQGGGIAVSGGAQLLRLVDSMVINNVADGHSGQGGGGIYAGGTIGLIRGSTIGNNVTNTPNGGGGGIYAFDSIATIENSTISYNRSRNVGGGISLRIREPDRSLTNATIANNTSSIGGGIYRTNTGVAIEEMINTIVANNTGNSFGHDLYLPNSTITVAQNNLIETAAGHSITNGVNGNKVGVDPKLGVLADNGGPTGPRPSWPAARPSTPGRARPPRASTSAAYRDPINGIVDIGAFEAQAIPANQAPVANSDAYTVAEDGALVVPAPVGPVLRYGFDEAVLPAGRSTPSTAASRPPPMPTSSPARPGRPARREAPRAGRSTSRPVPPSSITPPPRRREQDRRHWVVA